MISEHSIRRIQACLLRLCITLPLIGSSLVLAQPPSVHYFHRGDMPPGVVGRQQLLSGPGLAGYFQAVEVNVPENVRVSLMVDGGFEPPRPGPVLAGMLVSQVYQLKITNIPFFEGAELFPTVEVVNRLYPPAEVKTRFPVPIELTTEDLEMALDGRFVVRVIYLEDASSALPHRDDPRHQRVFEAGPQDDPLYVADRFGRPMAILRMGSRVPESYETSGIPGVGSPPIELYEAPAAHHPKGGTQEPMTRRIDSRERPIYRVSSDAMPRRAPLPMANGKQR